MTNEIVKILNCLRRKNVFYIYTSYRDEPYIVNEYLVTKYRLFKDKTFFLYEFEKILKDLNNSNIYNKALNFVVRNKTEFELKEYLSKLFLNEVEPEVINEIIDKFKHLGYIDDEKYARQYIYSMSLNLKGPLYIKFKLEQKGLDDSLIDEALEELDDSFLEPCKALANNSLKKTTGFPLIRQQVVLNQDLIRAGFLPRHIEYAINNIKYSKPSKDILMKEYNKLLLKKLDKDKIIQALLQKGFSYSDIINLIS